MNEAVTTPAQVLDFWFGAPGSPEHGTRREIWFRKSPEFDQRVRETFGATVEHALSGGCDAWAAPEAPPRQRLAAILLLDQFTRNIFRDSARMYDGDERAMAIAESMVARGDDRRLDPIERWFCYLPYEHVEDRRLQRRSLALFADLAAEPKMADVFEWARRHQVIVERFGRFPHRNALLGRQSTAEEIAFLKEPGSSF